VALGILACEFPWRPATSDFSPSLPPLSQATQTSYWTRPNTYLYASDIAEGKMKRHVLSRKTVAPLLLAVIVSFFASCGTQEPEGVKEYREITNKALTTVKATLNALDKVRAHSQHCPPKIVASFGEQVQRLQVDSLRVRARSQAILARGDAYFADWSANIANIKDPRVRQLAQRFRPELEKSFSKIKLASQKAGASFKPFQAGLQKARADLERKPDGLASDSGKSLLQEIRENGEQVVQELGIINLELKAITRMLTPTNSLTDQ